MAGWLSQVTSMWCVQIASQWVIGLRSGQVIAWRGSFLQSVFLLPIIPPTVSMQQVKFCWLA